MAIDQYQTNHFFRKADKILLKRYFNEKGYLEDFDFSQLGKRNIQALFDIWLTLDEHCREQMEIDFQDIHALANEVGLSVLVTEAEIQQRWEIRGDLHQKTAVHHNTA